MSDQQPLPNKGRSLKERVQSLAGGQVAVLAVVGMVAAVGLFFFTADWLSGLSIDAELGPSRQAVQDYDNYAHLTRIAGLACFAATAWLAFIWFGRPKK